MSRLRIPSKPPAAAGGPPVNPNHVTVGGTVIYSRTAHWGQRPRADGRRPNRIAPRHILGSHPGRFCAPVRLPTPVSALICQASNKRLAATRDMPRAGTCAALAAFAGNIGDDGGSSRRTRLPKHRNRRQFFFRDRVIGGREGAGFLLKRLRRAERQRRRCEARLGGHGSCRTMGLQSLRTVCIWVCRYVWAGSATPSRGFAGGCKAVRSRSVGDKIRNVPALREALGECCVDLR